MFEGLTGVTVLSAEESTPYAPTCAVVIGSVIEADLLAAGDGHGLLPEAMSPYLNKTLQARLGRNWSMWME